VRKGLSTAVSRSRQGRLAGVSSMGWRVLRWLVVWALAAWYADGPDEGCCVPVARDAGDADDGTGVWCVDEVAVSEPQADVPHAEEDDVAGPQLGDGVDVASAVPLRVGGVRQVDACRGVEVSREAGAVEAGWAVAGPDVGDALEVSREVCDVGGDGGRAMHGADRDAVGRCERSRREQKEHRDNACQRFPHGARLYSLFWSLQHPTHTRPARSNPVGWDNEHNGPGRAGQRVPHPPRRH
jgi:hypothetical protein